LALMIYEFLYFLLWHVSWINQNRIMNWLSTCWFWVLISNHKEIKELLAIIFHNTLINNSARSRINTGISLLLEEPYWILLVDHRVEYLWFIICSIILYRSLYLRNLTLFAFFKHCWTSYTISKNNDFLRKSPFVFILICLKCFF